MFNLLLGDSFELLKSLPDNSVDLIATDPPYEFESTKGGGFAANTSLNEILGEINSKGFAKGYSIEKYGAEFLRVLKSPQLYFWCNKAQMLEYFDFYVKKHHCKFSILTWHKPNAAPTYSNKYLADTEYLLYFHKGKGKCKPKNYEAARTFFVQPTNIKDKKKYGHPTIKPLNITEIIIGNTTEAGDVVLDPFMGSGTTGVACAKLGGRRFIGMEIDAKYYEIAKQRIEEAENEQKEV